MVLHPDTNMCHYYYVDGHGCREYDCLLHLRIGTSYKTMRWNTYHKKLCSAFQDARALYPELQSVLLRDPNVMLMPEDFSIKLETPQYHVFLAMRYPFLDTVYPFQAKLWWGDEYDFPSYPVIRRNCFQQYLITASKDPELMADTQDAFLKMITDLKVPEHDMLLIIAWVKQFVKRIIEEFEI